MDSQVEIGTRPAAGRRNDFGAIERNRGHFSAGVSIGMHLKSLPFYIGKQANSADIVLIDRLEPDRLPYPRRESVIATRSILTGGRPAVIGVLSRYDKGVDAICKERRYVEAEAIIAACVRAHLF